MLLYERAEKKGGKATHTVLPLSDAAVIRDAIGDELADQVIITIITSSSSRPRQKEEGRKHRARESEDRGRRPARARLCASER